ncbi:MAG TPA: hypothetical protein VGB85_04845 [Nannocystis sp.]|jgi:hypothetical protein
MSKTKFTLKVIKHPHRKMWVICGTAIPYIRDLFDELDSISCRIGSWSTRSSRTAHHLDICAPALVALAHQRAAAAAAAAAKGVRR